LFSGSVFCTHFKGKTKTGATIVAMKIFLGLAALALCVGCYTTYVDVSLQTGAGILRVSWTGNAEQQCNNTVQYTTWNADNSRLAMLVVASTSLVRVWDVTNNTEIGAIPLTNYEFAGMHLSPDGSELLVQRSSGSEIRFERYSSAGVLQASLNTAARYTALSTNLQRIAGVSGKIIRVWDTKTKALLFEHTLNDLLLEQNHSGVLALNEDGTQAAIYSAGQQQQVMVVDTATGQIISRKSPPSDKSWSVNGLVFHGDVLVVSLYEFPKNLSWGNTSSLQQWSLPSGKVLTSFPTSGAFEITPNGLFAVSVYPKFQVVDVQTNQEVSSSTRGIREHSPDLKRGLLAFYDSTVCGQQLVDLQQDKLLDKIVLSNKQDQSTSLTLTPSYKNSSAYTVKGTLQLGSQNLRVEGEIYAACVPGRMPGETVCERFQAQLSPLPKPFLRLLDGDKEVGVIRMYGFQANKYIEGALLISDKQYSIKLTPQ
jgi:hypothetical protein